MAATIQRMRPVLATLGVGGIAYVCLNRNIHAESGEQQKVFKRGPTFVSLPLESVQDVNHNTKHLRFKLPNEEDISGLSITSSVLTASWPQQSWYPVARPYTPISPPTSRGHLDLLVKKYPDGKQSTHLHSLQPGDKLLFVTALRGYQWQPNAVPHVTLIAGGAGITPIYQLAHAILTNPTDKTAVTVVYGANSADEVLLREEWERFRAEYGERFEFLYTVGGDGGGAAVRKGRVTKALLEEVLGKREGTAVREDMVFVCGPPGMEAALVGSRKERGILQELGFERSRIHTF